MRPMPSKRRLLSRPGILTRWLRPSRLKDLLLLLYPPLFLDTDAIQEVPMQDDYLAVVEEEKAKAIAE